MSEKRKEAQKREKKEIESKKRGRNRKEERKEGGLERAKTETREGSISALSNFRTFGAYSVHDILLEVSCTSGELDLTPPRVSRFSKYQGFFF